MTRVREFQESDAEAFGKLIADVFETFNLDYATPEERVLLLGPFRHAYSTDPLHQTAVAEIIRAHWMLVAEDDTGRIVGVLRGRPDRLQSLFVAGDCHGQGIGRQLVEQFETQAWDTGTEVIRLASSLFAVTFYQRMGYKKTTGVRSGPCFDGGWFPYQPMIKRFGRL